MVDIHGFMDEQQRTKERIAELKVLMAEDKSIRKQTRQQIKELEKDLADFYFQKATTNKLPQTYLYAPYSRRFRFFKLWTMFQKLLIIVITMFFPDTAYSGFRVRATGLAHGSHVHILQ